MHVYDVQLKKCMRGLCVAELQANLWLAQPERQAAMQGASEEYELQLQALQDVSAPLFLHAWSTASRCTLFDKRGVTWTPVTVRLM